MIPLYVGPLVILALCVLVPALGDAYRGMVRRRARKG
jgi:hypothetical protein